MKTVKTFLVLALAILTLSPSMAVGPSAFDFNTKMQTNKSVAFNPTMDMKYYAAPATKYERYQKMRKTGLILLCVGAPLLATGIACVAAGNVLAFSNNYDGFAYAGLLGAGAVGIVAGVGMTGAGIPLFIIGNAKSKKYKGDTSLNLGTTPNGVGLAYHF